jgi:hypothetical protein
MAQLIGRCWSLDPSLRPSFRDIFDEFEASGWAILPRADANLLAESVREIIALETRLNQSQS